MPDIDPKKPEPAHAHMLDAPERERAGTGRLAIE
jgi:hypothetical protein